MTDNNATTVAGELTNGWLDSAIGDDVSTMLLLSTGQTVTGTGAFTRPDGLFQIQSERGPAVLLDPRHVIASYIPENRENAPWVAR